ncbi:MAG: hypothetical protein U0L49_03575 [Eubacterium sp.]|nr:hypothetical protein [Eubacterium sp.]
MSKQKTWLGKNAKKSRKSKSNKVGQTPLEMILNVVLVIALLVFFASIAFTAQEVKDYKTVFPGRNTAEQIRDNDFQQVVRSYIHSDVSGNESDAPEVAVAKFVRAVYLENAAEKVGNEKMSSKWSEEADLQESRMGEYQDKADIIREMYSF